VISLVGVRDFCAWRTLRAYWSTRFEIKPKIWRFVIWFSNLYLIYRFEVAIVPAVVPKLASLRKSAKRDRLGALHWRKAERIDRDVRVRVGLDTGFMALHSIYVYLYTREYHALSSKNDTFKCFKTTRFCWELQWSFGQHHHLASVKV